MVSYMKQFIHFINEVAVLILIVVEDGLVHCFSYQFRTAKRVLILIVVDNGLVQL